MPKKTFTVVYMPTNIHTTFDYDENIENINLILCNEGEEDLIPLTDNEGNTVYFTSKVLKDCVFTVAEYEGYKSIRRGSGSR